MKNQSVILTPNRRLSATLLKQYHAFQVRQGKKSWATPVILPLEAWLQILWQQHHLQNPSKKNPVVLTPNQTHIIWENILRSSPENEWLLQPRETAELAGKAWILLKLWQVPTDHALLKLTSDGEAFQRWAQKFSEFLKTHNRIDGASLPEHLIKAIQSAEISSPATIQLAGFTEIAPCYRALFETLTETGCTLHPDITDPALLFTEEEGKTAHQICLFDEETEIRTMARWAKAQLEKQADKNLFIGCIIPRLDILRDRVLHIFSDVFSKPLTLTPHHSSLPFNISAGKKFSDWPVIRAAILLCLTTVRTLNKEETLRLGASPFKNCDVSSLTLSEDTDRQPPSHWVKFLSEFLTHCGWPGKRSLSSEEYQICCRWLDLLNEYATFDTLIPLEHLKNAVQGIQKLAERTVYQPETPEAPVQICGLLEAAGQPFTHLWMMGMDDSQWPFPPRPNPLIPLALQRNLQMPHATAERELHYCRELFQQFQNRTTHLICSYAGQLEDALLRPTALLQAIPVLNSEDLILSPHILPAEAQFMHREIESFTDPGAPPVTATEKLRGGSRILRQVAACPFRAFAEIRLHAAPPEPESTGLNASERGTLLHKTLESIWRQLKNSETLQQLSSNDLQALCETAGREALKSCLNKTPDDSRYMQMEWERIARLACLWLTAEKDRPPFRVIACEKPLSVSLKGLTFELRMDRVDELSDGTHLIIDYKTGKNASPNDWLGDRPEEPQLPLYCVSAPENISALAFATLHPEITRLSGLCAREAGIRTLKISPQWSAQIKEWQDTLNRLADLFCDGKADVDPKNGMQTCEHCHLQTFCRIHERSRHVTG